MNEWISRWLRIPPEPQAPDGAAGSLRVFRAAPNFYRLILVRWGLQQIAGLIGLVAALGAAHFIFLPEVVRKSGMSPEFFNALVILLEGGGFLVYVAQIPITFLVARLEYTLRWYLVTDRSLRIRSGVWTVEELTMTFANVQELTIHQGPLQRLLGIADLKVRSAGGGMPQQEGRVVRETHVGYFHGIEDASGVRDLILSHLRRYRDSGLGDPDERGAGEPSADSPRIASNASVVLAARELLEEARALRSAVEARET